MPVTTSVNNHRDEYAWNVVARLPPVHGGGRCGVQTTIRSASIASVVSLMRLRRSWGSMSELTCARCKREILTPQEAAYIDDRPYHHEGNGWREPTCYMEQSWEEQ